MTWSLIAYDLVDPNDTQGRTYKQVNAEKKHSIPIGALVEELDSGVRMFVMSQTRDCDMSLMYSLSPTHPNNKSEFNPRKWYHGYPEDGLKVIDIEGRGWWSK